MKLSIEELENRIKDIVSNYNTNNETINDLQEKIKSEKGKWDNTYNQNKDQLQNNAVENAKIKAIEELKNTSDMLVEEYQRKIDELSVKNELNIKLIEKANRILDEKIKENEEENKKIKEDIEAAENLQSEAKLVYEKAKKRENEIKNILKNEYEIFGDFITSQDEKDMNKYKDRLNILQKASEEQQQNLEAANQMYEEMPNRIHSNELEKDKLLNIKESIKSYINIKNTKDILEEINEKRNQELYDLLSNKKDAKEREILYKEIKGIEIVEQEIVENKESDYEEDYYDFLAED